MTTPSSKLQKYLRKAVEASGGSFRGVAWKGRSGCPDCFCWWPGGRVCFVEVKTGKDKLRPEQVRDVKRLRDDGVTVFEVRSEADMDQIVEAMSGAQDLRTA